MHNTKCMRLLFNSTRYENTYAEFHDKHNYPAKLQIDVPWLPAREIVDVEDQQ